MSKALLALLPLGVIVLGQSDGSTTLDGVAKSLDGAKSLHATLTVQVIGGAPVPIGLDLAKPNLARIDTPSQLLVADGATITTYDKRSRTYVKATETTASLVKSLNTRGLGIFAGFFDAKANPRAAEAKQLASVSRRGATLKVVTFRLRGGGVNTQVTYYLGSDMIPRQAEYLLVKPHGDETTILTAQTLNLGGAADSATFAFSAPSGARQLTEGEMTADKWYASLDEATAAAKASNRLVLVDFYTSWCHWCKVLREEVYPKDEFKAMSKYFVFCEIDAEAEPSIASRYQVDAYPTSVFIRPDGSLVHKLVGYKPLDGYLAEMEQAKSQGGL